MAKQKLAMHEPKDAATDFMINPWFASNLDQAFYENEEIASVRLRATEYLQAGVPVHLTGPPGLGKTALSFRIASALGRPISFLTGNAWLSSSDFVGDEVGTTASTVVDNYIQSVRRTERETRSNWGSSILAHAMKRGHTLIYDEFTRSTPEANSMLLSVLEEGLLVVSDPSCADSHIRANANFRMILISNPHDYAAVNSAPDALMDRVVTIELNNLCADTIAGIVTCRAGVPLKVARQIVNLICRAQRQERYRHYSILRSSIICGRIALFRISENRLDDHGIEEIVSDVLRGRGVAIGDDVAKRTGNGYRAA